MVINQWVPAAHRGDAVGDSARVVRDLLRQQGHSSNIYAMSIDDELKNQVRSFVEPESKTGDITILHFAVPSPMSDAFAKLKNRRVIQYHNVTPAHFFAPHDPDIFRLAALGREELKRLTSQVDLALGDSDYNRKELKSLGFDRTGVFPIMVNTDRITNGVSLPALEECLDDGLANILFVGRIAPNKCIEDHIRLAEHYKRYVDTEYRFVFVGRTNAVPRYYAAIQGLMLQYKLPPERFLFVGSVTDDELAVYYKSATAYVSLSEHEGFCVPLVEAMATDLPILAYGSSAVGETLGGSGLCFKPKDLEYAAELLGLLVYDQELREQVITGQRQRLANFSIASGQRALNAMIASLT